MNQAQLNLAKIALTLALAASAFLLSESANAQKLSKNKLPSAEMAVESENLLMLKQRLMELKKENKMKEIAFCNASPNAQMCKDKEEKKIKKLEKKIEKEEKRILVFAN